jgi:hypothetical protein
MHYNHCQRATAHLQLNIIIIIIIIIIKSFSSHAFLINLSVCFSEHHTTKHGCGGLTPYIFSLGITQRSPISFTIKLTSFQDNSSWYSQIYSSSVNAPPLPFIYSDKAVGTSATSTNFQFIPYLYSKQGYKPNIAFFWDAQPHRFSEDTTAFIPAPEGGSSQSYNTKIRVFYPDSPWNFHSTQLAVCRLLPLRDLRALNGT